MKAADRIEELEAALHRERQMHAKAVIERDSSIQRESETRSQFDDLKTRLHALEIENATMRGYIDRAQEDDHAREDLVQVGDPEGEQQLVPKRKHRMFPIQHFGDPAVSDRIDAAYRSIGRETPRRPKHWVTY